MKRQATFSSVIRVRNTKSAIEAIIACLALGIKKVQEGLDKRIFKLDEKFGWTLEDLRVLSRDKQYGDLIMAGVAVAKSINEIQGKINAQVPKADVAQVVKAVKTHTKKATKRAGRKTNKRVEQVKAATNAGASALAEVRAKFASSTVVNTPANQAPKPTDKAQLQEHIAQLLADAQAVARKRNPSIIDEAQAQLDRDVAAVLSMIG